MTVTSTPESPKPTEADTEADTDVVVATTAVPKDDDTAIPADPDDTADVPSAPAVATDPDDDSDEDEDDADADDADEDDAVPATVVAAGPSLAGAAGTVLALLAVVCLLLVSFGLPALKGAPHKVPIGVSGTPQITAQIKTLFAQGGSTSFNVHTYSDEAQLRKAITDRKIYGGLSVTTSAATMLVASGASPTVAQSLNSVASNLASQGGIQIPVDDVVPLPRQDARGAGFAAIGLPLVIAGILPSLLMLLRRFRSSISTALGVAFAFSLLSGFALGAILQFGFHAVNGNYLITALSMALGVAAISFPLTGLGAIAGSIGVGIGSALILLLGYPLSGISTAPEWFPGFWGTIGQALPPGAEATLLRSAAFFDGHGAGSSLIVLAAWTVGGLLLVVIGALINPADPFEDEELPVEPERELVPA